MRLKIFKLFVINVIYSCKELRNYLILKRSVVVFISTLLNNRMLVLCTLKIYQS
jgi:hypothetical protein